MNLILYLLAFVLAFAFKNKRKYDYILIIILCIICYLSPNIADMGPYSLNYYAVGQGDYSLFLGRGWLALCIVGNKLGLSYILFKTIIFAMGLLLIRTTIRKISIKKINPLLFYLIFPALLDCIQIRFFIAASIVVFAIPWLFKPNLKRIIFYILAVSVASLIHNSCLFYFIFCFIPLLKKFKTHVITILIFICVFAFIILKDYVVLMFYYILPETQYARINNYLTGDHTSYYGIIVYAFLFIIHLFAINRIKLLYANDLSTNGKMMKYEVIKTVEIINVFLCISIAFVFLNSDFMRLQRGMLILNYILFADALYYHKNRNINIFKIKIKLKFLIYFIMIIYTSLFIIAWNLEAITGILIG